MVKKHALRATIRSPLVARTAQYAPQEAMPSIMPRMTMVRASPWANNPSVFGRGLRFIMSRAGGSMPSAMAGRPSVNRFTNRIWMGSSVTGRCSSMPNSIPSTSPKLEVSRNRMNRRMFW